MTVTFYTLSIVFAVRSSVRSVYFRVCCVEVFSLCEQFLRSLTAVAINRIRYSLFATFSAPKIQNQKTQSPRPSLGAAEHRVMHLRPALLSWVAAPVEILRLALRVVQDQLNMGWPRGQRNSRVSRRSHCACQLRRAWGVARGA